MTRTPWEDRSVSVVMLRPSPLPCTEESWIQSAQSVLNQDVPIRELIIAPWPHAAGTNPGTENPPDSTDWPELETLRRPTDLPIRVIEPVESSNSTQPRATALRTAIESAAGANVLLIINDTAPVHLRRSALRTMLMAARRRPGVGLVYADYEILDLDGNRAETHLLDFHPGRLRETFDLGNVWLLGAEALEQSGGIDPADGAGDLYSLRLRISEQFEIVHIANRSDGTLYTVETPSKPHNVFDYLLSDRNAQLDLERALTEHLMRVGAFLPATRSIRPIRYTADEQRAFDDCVASVIIPVNQRPQFISIALDSVIAQTCRNIEVIVVVNGGENDPTVQQVRRYMPGGDRHDPASPDVRLLILDINNIGLSLNAGLELARGKYYVQLDSDDRLKPYAVEKLIDVFETHPFPAMVIGSYEVWQLDPTSGDRKRCTEIPVVTHDEWTSDNGHNNLLRVNGAGAPRSAHIKAINELGGFGVNDAPHCRNYGEDYDLVLRMSEHYHIGRVWEPIYEVIRHPGGTDHTIDQPTIDRNDNAKDAMRLDALFRRRAVQPQHQTENTKALQP